MTDFQQGMVVGAIVENLIWVLVLAIGHWLSGRELKRMTREIDVTRLRT